jgi:hypothetical protein
VPKLKLMAGQSGSNEVDCEKDCTVCLANYIIPHPRRRIDVVTALGTTELTFIMN